LGCLDNVASDTATTVIATAILILVVLGALAYFIVNLFGNN